MAYLNVNIHSGIVLGSSTSVNDKGSLDLFFKSQDVVDVFAAMGDGEAIESSSVTVKLFPCNSKGFGGKKKTWLEVANDLKNQAGVLREILKIYMTEKDAMSKLGQTAMFLGLGIAGPQANALLESKLQNDEFIAKVSANIFNAFVVAMKPHFESKTAFRVKFVRQSKLNSFPTITKKLRKSEPFIESMVVPEEQSLLAYTDYEIEKGYNSGAKAATDAPVAEEVNNAEVMFAAPGMVAQEGIDFKAPETVEAEVMAFDQTAQAAAPIEAVAEVAAAEEAPVVNFIQEA